MAKFIFNLQSVLNIKVKLEEQKKIELGNAMIYLRSQETVLANFKESLKQLIHELYQQNGKRLHAKDLIRLNTAIKYYEEEIERQKEVILKAKTVVEQKREALKKALIEKKTYEKLKEFALERYMQEEQAENNKLLDEISSFKQMEEVSRL